MKINFETLALSLMVTMASVRGYSETSRNSVRDREVNIGVVSVFVPSGFDSRSEVKVVASGLFPNTCYRWSRAETATNDQGVVEVYTKAMVREGMCLMMLVPFTNEVGLGRLGVGEHTVRFMSGDGTYLQKKIVIE
jgi:hypothetical protein